MKIASCSGLQIYRYYDSSCSSYAYYSYIQKSTTCSSYSSMTCSTSSSWPSGASSNAFLTKYYMSSSYCGSGSEVILYSIPLTYCSYYYSSISYSSYKYSCSSSVRKLSFLYQ